jgi:hypothetical protein
MKQHPSPPFTKRSGFGLLESAGASCGPQSRLAMLLASAAAAAWLGTPALADVEAKLPPDLRNDAWPKIEKTAADDKEHQRLFVQFYANRTAALRKLYETAATPEERNELRGPLIESAGYAESAGQCW